MEWRASNKPPNLVPQEVRWAYKHRPTLYGLQYAYIVPINITLSGFRPMLCSVFVNIESETGIPAKTGGRLPVPSCRWSGCPSSGGPKDSPTPAPPHSSVVLLTGLAQIPPPRGSGRTMRGVRPGRLPLPSSGYFRTICTGKKKPVFFPTYLRPSNCFSGEDSHYSSPKAALSDLRGNQRG